MVLVMFGAYSIRKSFLSQGLGCGKLIGVRIMVRILPYIQVILSVLLIAGILLQRTEASLGSAFGGDGAVGGRFMRRGLEKILFNATLVVAALFGLTALVNLVLS